MPIDELFFKVAHVSDSQNLMKLKQENMSLYAQLVDEKNLKNENTALSDQFAQTGVSSHTILPSHIVGSPGFVPGISSPEYLVVDRGNADGVHVGQIALYKNIVVGTIADVNAHYARVDLLTNNTEAIPVKSVKTNASGLLRGLGNGTYLVDDVVLADTLEKNDVIVTYGSQKIDGSGFPPGLLIGKITGVKRVPSALFQQASVVGLVDVTTISMIFISLTK